MGTGIVLELGAVSGCPGVVGPFQNAQSFATDVDVPDGSGIREAEAAVGCTEEVVPAFVGEFDFAVLQDDGGVLWDQDGPIDEPVCPFRFDGGHTGGEDYNTVFGTVGNGPFDGFAVGLAEIVVYVDHGSGSFFDIG